MTINSHQLAASIEADRTFAHNIHQLECRVRQGKLSRKQAEHIRRWLRHSAVRRATHNGELEVAA